MLTTTMDVRAVEDQHTSGAYAKRPLTIVRGAGCTLYDETGRAYLDMGSGIGVALLGHGHPAVAQAVAEQAQTLITCPEAFYNDRRAELYATLSALLPAEIGRFFLCNSGTEAVEAALKVARLLTGRRGIVSLKRGFHGRTWGRSPRRGTCRIVSRSRAGSRRARSPARTTSPAPTRSSPTRPPRCSSRWCRVRAASTRWTRTTCVGCVGCALSAARC